MPSLDDRVAGLLDEVRSNPRAAFPAAVSLARQAEDAGRADLVSQFARAAGEAARYATTLGESFKWLDSAIDAARNAGRVDLEAEARFTRSGSMAMAGRNAEALDELAAIEPAGDADLAARIDFQSASILARSGQPTEAAELFSRALPVFEQVGNDRYSAMVRQNRGMLYVEAGDTDAARRDFMAARDLYDRLDQAIWSVAMDHNLGLVAREEGDIRGALAAFDASEQRLAQLSDKVYEVQGSRVEALMSAGLFERARVLAAQMQKALDRVGLHDDASEARLLISQASLAAGRAEDAVHQARLAVDEFATQDRPGWVAAARLVEIKALWLLGQGSAGLRDRARDLAVDLQAAGRRTDATDCRLVAGRISLSLGDPEGAVADLSVTDDVGSGPFESRLQAWLARAILRRARSDGRGADAAARASFRLLGKAQASLGAGDMRSGMARHTSELGDIGLELAIESRKAKRVWQWMERTRATALQLVPISPPDDPALAGLLRQLRRVTADLSKAAPAAMQELVRRQVSIQHEVRRLSDRSPSPMSIESRVDIETLQARLGDRILVELAPVNGRLWSVVIRATRLELHDLGEWSPTRLMARRIRGLLTSSAASSSLSPDLAALAETLDGCLIKPIAVAGSPIVIVPPVELYGFPWSVLPSMLGRSLTIAPSASTWFHASARRSEGNGVLVATGPGLEHATSETREVARIHPVSTRFTVTQSNVEEVLGGLKTARIAHIAAHGVLDAENPLFSALALADGNLLIHDLERLGRTPPIVVLSACDTGLSVERFGNELFGFVTALLRCGSRSVIAGVGLVPDTAATKRLMHALHQGLAAGDAPADALATAQAAPSRSDADYLAKASFVCFGFG